MRDERVVVLVDMDCFYCQVNAREDPTLVGSPVAVVQYNEWKGGGIIAVNYEARAFGVTRNMRGDEARKKCPDIKLVKVPELRGKADLQKYRDAGGEVIRVLMRFGGIVERASVDEAYVDLTALVNDKLADVRTALVEPEALANTFVVGAGPEDEKFRKESLKSWLREIAEDESGNSSKQYLAVGAAIAEEMRASVYKETQFRCSAGISFNKMLAKLACGLHKPNRQTILPRESVTKLFSSLKISKLRGLGGKLGESVRENLGCECVSDLAQLSLAQIRLHFDEKTAQWLHAISRGFDDDAVKERDLPKSIGCGKNFRGREMLDTREKVERWMAQLCEELTERLSKDREVNCRVAKGLNVSVCQEGRGQVSRGGPLQLSYEPDKITRQAMSLVAKLNEASHIDKISWKPKLTNLSVSASKFDDICAQSISNFFAATDANGELPSSMVSAEELVPTLDDFDPSLPDLLPPILGKQVLARVHKLKEETEKEGQTPVSEAKSNDVMLLSTPGPSVPSDIVTDLENCIRCGDSVSPFEMPEHLDFHLAQDLQTEVHVREPGSKLAVRTVDVGGGGKAKKRKSQWSSGDSSASVSESSDATLKKQRDIKTFFSKI